MSKALVTSIQSSNSVVLKANNDIALTVSANGVTWKPTTNTTTTPLNEVLYIQEQIVDSFSKLSSNTITVQSTSSNVKIVGVGSGGYSRALVFTANGNWSIPTDVDVFKITAVGGGGGGGPVIGASTSVQSGAGGGAGGVGIVVYEVNTAIRAAGSIDITVGTGGLGGIANTTALVSAADRGGNTIVTCTGVGDLVVATGGFGGGNNVVAGQLPVGGVYGNASFLNDTYSFNVPTQSGWGGSIRNTAWTSQGTGSGGSGPYGTGGSVKFTRATTVTNVNPGQNGAGYGAGGAGASSDRSVSPANGGNGSAGLVIVEY